MNKNGSGGIKCVISSIIVIYFIYYISIMNLALLWALLAVVPTGIGATIGEALIGKKSLDTLAKNPNLAAGLKGMTILGIALVESAAIYGLVVALLILFTAGISAEQGIIAGWIIWAVGVFTCLCESWIVQQAIDGVLRNPEIESEIRGNMILFVALVESAAIYALVTSLLIIFA